MECWPHDGPARNRGRTRDAMVWDDRRSSRGSSRSSLWNGTPRSRNPGLHTGLCDLELHRSRLCALRARYWFGIRHDAGVRSVLSRAVSRSRSSSYDRNEHPSPSQITSNVPGATSGLGSIMGTHLPPSELEKIATSFATSFWWSFGVCALAILPALFLPKAVSPEKEVLQVRAATT